MEYLRPRQFSSGPVEVFDDRATQPHDPKLTPGKAAYGAGDAAGSQARWFRQKSDF